MKTKVALEYKINENNTEKLPVIVVAAGNFTRMNGVNKQLTQIGGMPVIIRTLTAFQNCDRISNIILVVRADNIFSMQFLTEEYNITKLSDIVCGGNSRQESVLKGLARVGADTKAVMIHDGARPLVSIKIIEDVAAATSENPAVTCGVSVIDTVKQIDENSKVVKTIDRNSLVTVQTPQAVWIEEYKNAVDAVGDVSRFTDDTSIMEAAGYPVLVTEGSRSNIKITTQGDIAFATALLEEEI